MINDFDIAWANLSLPWRFEQATVGGRIIGRGTPIPLIDYRIQAALDAGVEFVGKRVLEPGCGEGHITVGLLLQGAKVVGFDSRMPNLLKAYCRCAVCGFYPELFYRLADQMSDLGWFGMVFHSGLLYHLPDPVAHFRAVAMMADEVLLDTHTVPTATAELHGYAGMWWKELGGPEDMLAGMQAESFWLTKDSLARLFDEAGFSATLLLDDDAADFGPRSLWRLQR